jgi:hypothetical protein
MAGIDMAVVGNREERKHREELSCKKGEQLGRGRAGRLVEGFVGRD